MPSRSASNLTSRRKLDVFMDLTPRCNIYCTMCLLPLEEDHSKGAEMSNAVYERIVDEIFPQAKCVALSCGSEPFMSKRFLPALEAAVARGVPNVRFVTNGLLMTDEAVEQIVDLGVNRITISLDGATAATYESIRVGGKFDRLKDRLHALRLAKRRKRKRAPVVKLSWVLMRSNLHEVLDLVELAHEVEAGEIYLRHLVPFTELDVSDQLLVDHPRWTNWMIQQAWERCRSYGIRMTTLPILPPGRPSLAQQLVLAYGKVHETFTDEGLGGVIAVAQRLVAHRHKACDIPWCSVYVRPDGGLNPCGAWFKEKPLGDLGHQSWNDISEGDDFRHLRAELTGLRPLRTVCAQCPNVVSGRINQQAFTARSAWASGRPSDWKPRIPKILERARKRVETGTSA